MASSGGKRALPSPDVILLHATVKLEAAVACSSAERSATAVLEAARLFVRGDPSSSALDASAVFVDLCALLTDHDVAIRRDACRLLASVPLARVPAQRLSQAVSKRPIKETVPGAPVQRASKIGKSRRERNGGCRCLSVERQLKCPGCRVTNNCLHFLSGRGSTFHGFVE